MSLDDTTTGTLKTSTFRLFHGLKLTTAIAIPSLLVLSNGFSLLTARAFVDLACAACRPEHTFGLYFDFLIIGWSLPVSLM